MAADTSLLAPAILAAALVIRAALGELQRPGSAREQWAFVANRQAVVAGTTVLGTVILLGWHQAGLASLAWGLLIGALTAHLVHGGRRRP
ncbi:hypothetical protein OG568_15220 [Streptomyces sp. NBC_01450]|uniref:hypothetical protein n=1 Tax=Streptomyces sp. NBC_01450 TaxID=2903871 RepID=UPI002E3795F2|nr:hypothetical protein [Streptomyces sp. NBC_01450]